MKRSAVCALISCAALAAGLLAETPTALAKNGDTHVSGVGSTRTVDCNDSVLFVNGANNTITALGNCWAITMQGSYNTVIADHVINDITVYGFEQTAFFKNGSPALIDRGRELGMTNRIARVPA